MQKTPDRLQVAVPVVLGEVQLRCVVFQLTDFGVRLSSTTGSCPARVSLTVIRLAMEKSTTRSGCDQCGLAKDLFIPGIY